MDEENNNEMRSGNLDQEMETGKAVAQGAANKVSGVANKVTDAVRNQNAKRKRIKGAKAQVGDTPGKWVSPAKKAKGKVYQAKGNIKSSLGTGLTAAGLGAEATGSGTRALAQGIRGAGTLASAIPYVGPAIKSALEGVAKTADTAGKNIQKFGKKVRKQGLKNVKSGLHDIKRGNQLANTGKDIGPKGGAANGMGSIPNMPAQPNIPSIPSIINNAKEKAKLNPLKGGNPLGGLSKKKKLILIGIAIAAIIIIILIVMISISSEYDQAAYIEGDKSNVPYVVSSEIMDRLIIVQDENGGYKYAFQDEEGNTIEFDEAVENALQTLRDNGSNALDYLGKNDEEQKTTLKKLIQAEMMTQYPILSTAIKITDGDFCVDTSQTNCAKVCTEEELKTMVNNCSSLSDQAKQNLLSVIPDLVKYQEQYHVNAVYAMAVTRVESGCGTAWDLIDSSTYNWVSIKGQYNGNYYTDRNGTQWKKYKSYSEAIEDFCNLMSKDGGHYFSSGNYTVESIASIYCNEAWGDKVEAYMTEFYESAGISMYSYDTDSETSADIDLFLQLADKIYQNISNNKLTYNQTGSGRRNPTVYINENISGYNIDCSSYVSAVLYAFDSEKYSRFAQQQSTYVWYPNVEEWALEYGWTTFTVDSSTTINDLQPGDIIIFNNGVKNHVQIYAGPVDSSNPRSDAYVYDCGGHSNWLWSSDYHDAGNKDFWRNVGAKVIRLSDDGGMYAYVTSGELQGGIKVQRRSSSGSTKTLRFIDEESFDEMIVSGKDNCLNYFTLKKASSINSGSSESISGSDLLNDWVASWEDSSLFLYKKGLGSYNSAVAKQMTEDGKYYICTGDGTNNGTLNYGFGVCVYNPSDSGWMHVEAFSKYGVDITTSVLYETQVEVDIVDAVKSEELQAHYDYIKNKLDSAGVELTVDQINALCGVAYQFGDSGANIDSFIELYKKYGNTEELRQNYTSKGGTKVFVHVKGGTNSEGIDRAAANWALFHDGIYYAGSGGTLDKSSYGTYTNTGSETTASDIQSQAVTVEGNTVQEQCWNFLTKTMGYSDAVAAGVMGNIEKESSFNPQAINNGQYYGLFQWSLEYNPEINNASIEQQFEYFQKWISKEFDGYASNYKSGFSYSQFLQMTDPGEAARAFSVIMERFCGKNPNPYCSGCNGRAESAQKFYSQMGGSSSSSSTSISNLNNFLFIGDSRYAGNQSISSLGSDIKNAGVASSSINDWITVVKNGGTGTVNGKTVDISGTYSGISVQLGVNDIYNNVGNTESSMKTLVEQLKELYPNTPIFINSCMQVSSKENSSESSVDYATYRDNIETLNNDIANYCNQVSNVYYVDISNDLYDAEGYLKDEYASNNIDCNSEGQKIFAENLKNGILSASTSSNSSSSTGISSGSNYVIVVANKKTVTTKVVDSYEYEYTTVTDTSTGYRYSGTKSTETPASSSTTSSETTYSSVVVDFQTSLKSHTLYFDFLWAILVDSGNKTFTLNWADLALKGSVDLTIYNDEYTSKSENSQACGNISKSAYSGGSEASVDYYSHTITTTITTNTVTSKAAITKADTWLINYENNPNTYAEYQSKSEEQIIEKVDPDDSNDNIVKLLRSKKDLLKQLTKEKYRVDRALENNEKVKFMSDIYEYVLNIANNKADKNVDLQTLMNTGSFDLNSFTTVSSGVISSGSGTVGVGTGQGATGGVEQAQAGDGYKTVFIVGDRTYKNYKQSDGSYQNEAIALYGSSMKSSGCAITAVAVIATGYGVDMSPHDVNQYYKNNGIGGDHEKGLSKIIGKNCYWKKGSVSQTIIDQLKSGKPCMVHSSSISASGHFFCVLAISEDGTQVYVSDVGGYYASGNRNGWLPISYLNIMDRCMIIED